MAFTGVVGSQLSTAAQMIPGYGATSIHYSKSNSASMTATAVLTNSHIYIFTIVSITVYRAVSRTKRFISVFRTA